MPRPEPFNGEDTTPDPALATPDPPLWPATPNEHPTDSEGKQMNDHPHQVCGFFSGREDAQSALATLVDRGLAREALRIIPGDPVFPDTESSSDKALKDILVDGAIGTAVGSGLGVLAEVALVAGNVSLFLASPLLAPLVMLGWGAGIGGIVGASIGAEKKDRSLSQLIRDAVSTGQVVLVARTHTADETTTAQQVMRDAVGTSQAVSTV